MGNPLKKGEHTSSKNHLEPHQIILRPLVTEKGVFQSTEFEQFAFEVNPLANKADVKRAIEELFDGAIVSQVRTQNRPSKPRRYRFRKGHTKNWKKAIVTLDPSGRRIDFF